MGNPKEYAKAREEVSRLLSAAKRGDVDGMKRCVDNDNEILAGTKDGNKRTTLHFAAVSGRREAVEWVLQRCPGLRDSTDATGVTALALAASQGKDDSVAALVKAKSDINCADDTGATALHRAAAAKSLKSVEILLKNGADVNKKTSSGTPLHWAAGDATSPVAILRSLLSSGATVDATDDRGLTPIILAAAVGNSKAVVLLAEHHADAGTVVSGGATIAHICADTGDASALTAIVTHATNGLTAANNLDHDGRSARDVAIANNFPKCADILAQAGVRTNNPSKATTVEETKEEVKPKDEEATTQEDFVGVVKDAPEARRRKDAGNAALAKGDFEKAVTEYSAAIDLDSTEKVYFSNRAAARLALGEKTNAKEVLDLALADAETSAKLDPTWPKAHFRRGSVLVALDRFEDAANAFWDALRIDSSNDQIKAALRDCVDRGRAQHAAAQAQAVTTSS